MSSESRTFRPRLAFLALFAALTALVGLVLHFLVGLSLSVVFLSPIGGAIGYAWAISLTTSSQGVKTVGGPVLPWGDAVVTSTRWGESLTGAGPRTRKTVRIFLPMYAANWRTDALGVEIRRWAPHLTAAEPPR